MKWYRPLVWFFNLLDLVEVLFIIAAALIAIFSGLFTRN